jgi:hypothetical protein
VTLWDADAIKVVQEIHNNVPLSIDKVIWQLHSRVFLLLFRNNSLLHRLQQISLIMFKMFQLLPQMHKPMSMFAA